MKFSNILLSVFIHVGLIAGVMHILQCRDKVEYGQLNPIFFEFIEECAIATPEQARPTDNPSKNKCEASIPLTQSAKTTNENTVRTEFSEEDAEMSGNDMCEVLEDDVKRDGEDVVKESELEEEKSDGVREEKNETGAPAGPGNEDKVVKAAEEVCAKVLSAPVALNRIVPVYPHSARRRGREGSVTVEISVSDSGVVSDVEVVAGSGYKELDAAAVSAVRTARFAPATEDGVQVYGRLRLTFDFKLR